MNIINTIFPASENVFNNIAGTQNTFLYWQNRSDGDIVYNTQISQGTYDITTLKTEIETKVALVSRIMEVQFSQYTSDNIITVDFNTNNNITTFKSFRKYIFLSPPITNVTPSPSTLIGTYTITINQPLHNLVVNDAITFFSMIDHLGIPASILNSRFLVNTIIDTNNYTIQIIGVNVNTNTLSNNTGGGFEVTGLVDNYFRLLFDKNITIGTNVGFRNVGSSSAITSYNTILKNTDPYYNEPPFDQNGVPTDYNSGRIQLNQSPYFFISCLEIKDKIKQQKNMGKNVPNVIAKINCSKIRNGNYYDTFMYAPIIFYEPVNLSKLSFAFYTPYGNLMDFGNENHSFILQLEYSNEKPDETYIDSSTGIQY